MRKTVMGPGGPEISVLGIGAMSFSDFYGATTDDASFAIMDAAMELDVTHMDTSNVYGSGRSETVIGQFLESRGTAARDHFHIATKAGITQGPDGKRMFRNDFDHLQAELDKSLTRLGVEAVDLFYVHRRDPALPIEEVTESLMKLVRAGKTRAIGFSEIAPSSLRRAAAVAPIAAVQSEYSLATRSPEMGLVQACAELGTTLVAFSPVGRSLLTDDPLRPETVAKLPFLSVNPRFQVPNHAANLALTDRFRALAAEMNEPAAALSMAWLLAQGAHVVPIPGTRSVAHFRDLVRGTELTLSAEDLARIAQVLPIGWAHGDRYQAAQWVGPERYC